MKIFCHNGIAPDVSILNQYGIRIQDVFKSANEWELDAYIIELPKNLKIVRGNNLPQCVSSSLSNVIIDENDNIICSLSLSDVNYQYESENVPEDQMYDYHCFGTPKFYKKGYPSPTQLESIFYDDMDKYMDIIDEMRKVLPSKENNKIQISRDLPINNSVLVDDIKTLNLVRQEINKRGVASRTFAVVPEAFEEIEQSKYKQMQEIDLVHQKNFISREQAIEMIADLFERDGMVRRFEKYVDSVFISRLRKLFELIETKYQALLNALNTGKIDQIQFQESIAKLREFETNSMQEIILENETLKGRSK